MKLVSLHFKYIDDIINRLCHLHHQARQLRKQSYSHESEIQDRAKSIASDHTAWLSLPVVQTHIPNEAGTIINGSLTREKNRFLHYPEYPISDAVFTQILLYMLL